MTRVFRRAVLVEDDEVITALELVEVVGELEELDVIEVEEEEAAEDEVDKLVLVGTTVLLLVDAEEVVV